MKKIIDLTQKKAGATAVVQKAYDYLLGLPEEIRKDDKERTGIIFGVREEETRNAFRASIYEPSDMAHILSVEKMVRARLKGDHSSQNSRDVSNMRFGGSVSVVINGVEVFAFASGLKEEEDVAIDIILLAYIFDLSTLNIVENIEMYQGELPECFKQKDHYLCQFLNL